MADVLRRIGLTGVKIGCGIGVCGVCSVLVDGKVVRSCTKKMKTVKEFAEITTIEGVGTPNHLHPLQQAFITYGSVQCGFCIPGFIVSAYQLLKENPDPAREEVRAWFKKNHNYCRCTGYKQIVDAVMAAAKVMRGEADMDSLIFDTEQCGGEFHGSKLPRPSALGKVTGTLDYGEDMSLKLPDDLLHVAIVQPKVTNHANIISIDTTEAEAMPGVVKVITSKDILAAGGNNMINQYIAHPRSKIMKPTRQILCDQKILRYGDVIGLVVADSVEHAREAAKKVKMEYEQLPEYMNVLEAVAPGAEEIHPGYPNTFLAQNVVKGEDADEAIKASAHEVTGSYKTSRQPHLSMEGDIVLAYRDENGKLTLESKSQAIYPNLKTLGGSIGVEEQDLRVLQHGAVGASFGWALDPSSLALAGAACIITGRPVSLVMTWEEHQHYAGKRSSMYANCRLGCDEKGNLTGLEYDMAVDHGAYVEGADSVMVKYMHMGVPYKIPNVRGVIRMVSTNHNHTTAWRGYGMPQVTTAMENLMDRMAVKLGIDPFEFRYQNIMQEGDVTTNGETVDCTEYRRMMDMARPVYQEWKKRAEENSTPEMKRGVGVTPIFFIPLLGGMDKAETRLEIKEDNKIYVYNTYHEMGQGGDIGNLTNTLEALKSLGIRPEDVVLDMNDSEDCPNCGMSAGSRTHFMSGGAIIDAAKQMLDARRKEDGTYRTYQEMVAEGKETSFLGHFSVLPQNYRDIDFSTGLGGYQPKPMIAVCVAEVEVEVATGKTKVRAMKVWANCGKIANRLSAEGQAYGGMGQSIGYGLKENYEDLKKDANIVGAGIPSIEDIPDDIEIIWIEDDPCKAGPFGSNGLSEIFFAGEHNAVLNAIYQATGARVYQVPARPEVVKEALDKVAKGEEPNPPAPYFLGSDFYDILEELIDNPVPENWYGRLMENMTDENGVVRGYSEM